MFYFFLRVVIDSLFIAKFGEVIHVEDEVYHFINIFKRSLQKIFIPMVIFFRINDFHVNFNFKRYYIFNLLF